jgi:hypothetical protein
MHLVGFIIEIYYDARPYELQLYNCVCSYVCKTRTVQVATLAEIF